MSPLTGFRLGHQSSPTLRLRPELPPPVLLGLRPSDLDWSSPVSSPRSPACRLPILRLHSINHDRRQPLVVSLLSYREINHVLWFSGSVFPGVLTDIESQLGTSTLRKGI